MIPVYVGYDTREHAAWMVCRDTLLHPLRGAPPRGLEVNALSHRELRRRLNFSRPWRIDEDGQMHDERDGKPFSTEFSHSRFLVPKLARTAGVRAGPVVFCDCDFMWMRPITEMLDALDPTKVVSVVKHDSAAVKSGVKMDRQPQSRYYRKLWSSLMVFNMGHPDIDLFLGEDYDPNREPGADLHALSGLGDGEVGAIDPAWNWVPGLSNPGITPRAVHWSLGGPWMEPYANTPYAHEWRSRYRATLQDAVDADLTATFALV